MKNFFLTIFLISVSIQLLSQTITDNDTIYELRQVSKQPQFTEGNILSYIRQNIRYPHKALENNITGTVYIQFVINKKGEVVNPIIGRKVNSLLDKEALRIVKSVPNWIPAEKNGENVNVKYTIPIRFNIIMSSDPNIVKKLNKNIRKTDSVSIFLDENYSPVDKENASYLRTVLIKDNKYFMTDKTLDNDTVDYYEFKSINPWIHDGLSIHYSNPNVIYSKGYYSDGKLTGKWFFYRGNKVDTIDYSIVEKHEQLNSCNNVMNPRTIANNGDDIETIKYMLKDSIYTKMKITSRTINAIEGNNKAFFSTIPTINVCCVVNSKNEVSCIKMNKENDYPDLLFEVKRILYSTKFKFNIIDSMLIKFDITPLYFGKNMADTAQIFTLAEEMPLFISKGKPSKDNYNSQKELLSYIKKNVNSRALKCDGRVIARFIVEKDGNVNDVKIISGQDKCPDLARNFEAILKSTKWKPAKRNKRSVRVSYMIPISGNR